MRALPALWLCFSLALALPTLAQPAAPGSIPVSPDRSAVSEQQLLQAEPRITGRIDIPDSRASVLIQPAGRRWVYFREVQLHWLGGVVLLGMLAVLALAYFVRGPLRISAGRSGREIIRFNAFERFSHWLTAVSFVLLGLTGLNITFGRLLLLPTMGATAFSAWSQWSKYIHNFVSFAFMLGLLLIVGLFLKDNIPHRVDLEWLKQGGGFVKSRHAPAGRFNAGEKAVFWLALLGGLAVIVSGLYLLFPFYLTNIAGMQTAQVIHAIIAVLFVALILAHIYIGTLGTEGAFEAMGSGTVDVNWAKEHHDQWFADELAKGHVSEASPATPPAPAR